MEEPYLKQMPPNGVFNRWFDPSTGEPLPLPMAMHYWSGPTKQEIESARKTRERLAKERSIAAKSSTNTEE